MFKRKLALLQNSFDTSIQQVRRPKGGRIPLVHLGESVFIHEYDFVPIGSLIRGGTNNSKVEFYFVGEASIAGEALGISQLSTIFTLLSQASLLKGSNVSLRNVFDFGAIGSRSLYGTNSGSIIFNLGGNGTTAATEDGAAALAVIFSLLSSGALSKGGSTIFDNKFALSSRGNNFFGGSSAISHTYGLSPTGSRLFAGNTLSNVLFLLHGDGSTASTQDGAALLSLIHQLSVTGSLTRGATTNFALPFQLSSGGKLDLGGSTSMSHIYQLASRLSGDMTGQFSGDMIFDLYGSLTTNDVSIQTLSFILGILQSRSFSLPINRSKTFTLKV